MTVKWVTGKLGAGKGLYCDYEMVKYYREGRRVVTNYPVDTHLLGPDSVNPVTVLPAHPRPQDLQALGRGCPDEEKEKFGAVFLDEAGTWLNSRTYGDKNRLALIDWFIHSRHLGWDVFIIVQNEEMIDKQIALATGEVLVVCKRSDRAQGVFRKLFQKLTAGKSSTDGSASQKSPSGLFRHRVIVETYFQRKSARDKPFDKFSFFADWYFGIHDTNHIFEDGYESLTINGQLRRCDMRCMYSLLPGRTISQWYHANDPVIRKPVISKRRLFTVLFFGSGTFLSWYFLVAHKQPDTAAAQVQTASSSPSAAAPASGSPGTTVQAAPSPPPLSTSWRLTGYLKSGTGKPRYVIRDNAGNVRYIASSRPWDGVYSEILVDGTRVTFWTGADRAPGSQGGGESPLSTAAAPVLSALGMGDTAH
ncbi:TPA: zonular occludens toxin domain-containing protein [Salmonella enterica]